MQDNNMIIIECDICKEPILDNPITCIDCDTHHCFDCCINFLVRKKKEIYNDEMPLIHSVEHYHVFLKSCISCNKCKAQTSASSINSMFYDMNQRDMTSFQRFYFDYEFIALLIYHSTSYYPFIDLFSYLYQYKVLVADKSVFPKPNNEVISMCIDNILYALNVKDIDEAIHKVSNSIKNYVTQYKLGKPPIVCANCPILNTNEYLCEWCDQLTCQCCLKRFDIHTLQNMITSNNHSLISKHTCDDIPKINVGTIDISYFHIDPISEIIMSYKAGIISYKVAAYKISKCLYMHYRTRSADSDIPIYNMSYTPGQYNIIQRILQYNAVKDTHVFGFYIKPEEVLTMYYNKYNTYNPVLIIDGELYILTKETNAYIPNITTDNELIEKVIDILSNRLDEINTRKLFITDTQNNIKEVQTKKKKKKCNTPRLRNKR